MLLIVMEFMDNICLSIFQCPVSVSNMPLKRKQSDQPQRSTRTRQTGLNHDIQFVPDDTLPIATLPAGTLPDSNHPGAISAPPPAATGLEVSALPPSFIGQIATEVSSAEQASLQAFLSLGIQQHGPSTVVSTSGINLPNARLDPKIEAKIWSNGYFDFEELIYSAPKDSQYNIRIASANGSSTPTLCLERTNKAKSISSIEVWTSAFQVFEGVYTASKYPLDSPALMKYSEVVRDLVARGCDWRYYNTNFCYLHQQNPTSMPWGVTYWEVWFRS